jgi:Cellulase (glycosyl hydrolase family 5)
MSRHRATTANGVLSVIAVVIMLVGLVTTVLAQSRSRLREHLLKIDGKYQPVRGMNLAWLNGCAGHDFGHLPEHPDWGVCFNANDLDNYFADMNRMNVNVVRIFAFESLEGLQFDQKGYVNGLDPELVRNFDTTLVLAKSHGLHLYLCLANDFRNACGRTKVKDIVGDPKALRAYLDNVVRPFVTRFKGDSAVFAFDIMNEPEQDIAGPTGNYRSDGHAWTTMRSFIRANATLIHSVDPKRLVSCGSGWHASGENIKAGRFSGLGLDFYDLHEYRNDGYLPSVDELGVSLPVLVGEFGPDNQQKDRNDERQKGAVEDLLRSARDGGYAGAAYWSYEYPNVDGAHLLAILRGGGSGEWRPAGYVLRDFSWERTSPVPTGGSPKMRRRR